MFGPLVASLLALAALLGPPSGGARAEGPEVVAPTGELQLEVRKGRLLRLAGPVTAVFVADPEVADVQAQSSTLLYVYGRRAGTTTLYAVDDAQQIVLRRDVQVRHNLTRLRQVLAEAIPDQPISLQSVEGGLILGGQLGSAVAAQEAREIAGRFLGENETLINRLKVAAPTQVSLHVRVAEVSREVIKLFGINWETLFSPGDFVFGLATGRGFVDPLTGGVGRLTDSTGTAGALFGSYRSGDVNVNAIIDALEREGLVTVLAQPNLTALSGETASFLAGGEFPVPVGADDNEIQIEFKQFGISLAFTPTVLSPDRISLRVRPEVSDISEKGAIRLGDLVIPALSTRRAETTVEIGSGQSFAIGGLVSNSTRSNLEKFPGLGDLPVLGTLFRSTNFQRSESELVIVVTPYLVRPVAATAIRTPLDELRPASDLERILSGRVARSGATPGSGRLGQPGGPRLRGAAGFVLE
jgi:pilus assembly protein CpaC